MILNAKEFWDKTFTKQWLSDNTSLAYPATLINPGEFYYNADRLINSPVGEYVWKPQCGRQNSGVALLEKTPEGFMIFSYDHLVSASDLPAELDAIRKIKLNTVRKLISARAWFVEEWIHPAKQLHKFTDDVRCPPIIRFIGQDRVDFITMTAVYFKHEGISTAGWKKPKYILVDLEGVVRDSIDMDLSKLDHKSTKVVQKKTLDVAHFGGKIEGIAEVVGQINKEVAPKVTGCRGHRWSVDGTFDENNKYVVIEMNHFPGAQFLGAAWKK
jgi:hypothetical protein